MIWVVATETIERSGGNTPLEPAEEPYAIIPLFGKHGTGKVAKVSLCDVARVRRYKWYGTRDGYALCYIAQNGKHPVSVLMHRYILQAGDGVLVDHKKHDRLDNRRSKIRPTDAKGNAQNTGPRVGKYKGVHFSKAAGKHLAYISINGENIRLGQFDNPVEAAKVYDACARYHHGEFAFTNFEGDEKLNAYEAHRNHRKRPGQGRGKSRYLGVTVYNDTGWFQAYVCWGDVFYIASSFESEVEAAKVRDAMARFYLGPDVLTNFEGNEKMDVEQGRARARLLAFQSGHKSSRFLHVTKLTGRSTTSKPWMVSFKPPKGGDKTFSRRVFDTEVEAAIAADDARAAYGLPRVNFPDEPQAT